jgi:hypothetical protein
MKKTNPILVTGSHRSGTTWVGHILSSHRKIAYLHEPFNPPYAIIRGQFENSFQFICEENEGEHKHKIDNVTMFRYPFLDQLSGAKSTRRKLAVLRDFSFFLKHRIARSRPLVKDPLALLSSEWFYKTYKADMVILVRHPAAFCSSLKLKNWQFDFANFSTQKAAMQTLLEPFKDKIEEYSLRQPNIIDQGILIWNIAHSLIADWEHRYKEWNIVRHEDLSLEPMIEFEKLHQNLGIPFNKTTKECILKSSGSHNPKEQTKGKEFVRDSKANIDNWKKRLTDTEITKIRGATEKVSRYFYTDRDW